MTTTTALIKELKATYDQADEIERRLLAELEERKALIEEQESLLRLMASAGAARASVIVEAAAAAGHLDGRAMARRHLAKMFPGAVVQ